MSNLQKKSCTLFIAYNQIKKIAQTDIQFVINLNGHMFVRKNRKMQKANTQKNMNKLNPTHQHPKSNRRKCGRLK